MKILQPKESLSKSYRCQPIPADDYNRFLSALRTLIANINDEQPEVTQKDHFMVFLKNSFYSQYIVGAGENNIDLAIRLDNTTSSNIAVMFEIKSTTNSGQMVTRTDLNRKAMHELLLYYFKERENGNNDVKYLVITNLREFFIFDARTFEQQFYKNKKFLKEYRDFVFDRKVNQTVDTFYKEIAPKYIKEAQDIIEFTYFDLTDYKVILESNEQARKLTDLYRIFSPVHLLKLPFSNDCNSLDKNFYEELLYLLGLNEYKDHNKLLIGRLKDNAQPASLIESTINIIRAESILPNDIKGNDIEVRYFNAAMELIITWINRILFLKLLESQLVKYHKGNIDYKFLTYEKINDFDTLNSLFFQVLGVPIDQRSKSATTKFPNVPYLNSSLFELTNRERQIIRISNIQQSGKLPIHNRSILIKSPYYKNKKSLPFLEYIFAFLDAYNFSSEGTDEIQEQSKTLISASVLGLLFEKINGYKDGSVFTPGFITSYMCREAITKVVVDKFNSHYGWSLSSYDELLNQDLPDTKEANEIINSIRICDPAVGSGHFLVSALNEIIHIKYELGALFDVNGKRLKKGEYTISIENDELIIIDGDGELWTYNPKNEESRRVQQAIFNEKKIIIENCLFGVDINPNSVNICRLRLWIELLKNAYYTAESGYTLLETLPNIDINIKCGNSLLSYFNLTGKIEFPKINSYKKLVREYKSSLSKTDKHNIEEKIATIKEQLSQQIILKNPIVDEYQKAHGKYSMLTSSNLFDEELSESVRKLLKKKIQTAKKNYERASAAYEKFKNKHLFSGGFEWRVEFPEVLDEQGNFVGFDLVIGNPPYFVYQDNHVGEIKQLRNIVDYDIAFGGKLNAYKLFLANALRKLLKPDGTLSFIFQNSFLGDLQATNLRKFVLNNNTILKIDSFPERDNKKKRIFESAKMSVCIILVQNTPVASTHRFPLYIWDNKDKTSGLHTSFSLDEIVSIDPDCLTIPRLREQEIPVVIKLIKHRHTHLHCIEGELNMTLHKPYFGTDVTNPPILKGAAIQRYRFTLQMSQGEIEYLDEYKYMSDFGASPKSQHHLMERIAMQGMTGANDKVRLVMSVIPAGYYLANSCNYILTPHGINPYALLAILNSSVMNWFFRCFSTNSNVNGYEVNNFPIPYVDDATQTILSRLAKLAGQQDSCNYNIVTKYIDIIVARLYDLSFEELLITDPLVVIKREEYNELDFDNVLEAIGGL